jgi:hypothetical protein
MRISDWAQKFNLAVKRCEERPDRPQGDIVYRVKDIFTTLLGSWDPSTGYGAIPQWARDAYLKPAGADDYLDEGGADHNLFALVLGLDGQPVKTGIQVRYWSDGIAKLGDAGYTGYVRIDPKPRSGWTNLDIWNSFSPERGEQGTWCWCPDGASDVAVGGGMPNNNHVSTFVVWQAERRAAVPPAPTPDPGGVTPGATFTITPERVVAGQEITLKWSFTGAQAVTLTGPSVAGLGALTFTLARTGQYTLHAALDDGTTLEKSITVIVDDAPPSPPPVGPPPNPDPTPLPVGTRPPTVVLTADNIARLRSFPRPANDNGRGLHFSIDLRDDSIAWTVDKLRSIDARWTLIYAQDELQAGRAARACWNAGIMPVVRVGKKINEPCDSVPWVRELEAIGAPPYVQIFNEPSDGREWRSPVPADATQVFAHNWANQAAAVVDAGGYPGLQVLEKEELDAAVDAVAEIKRPDIWERAFFCLHNYGANHPPLYPYDIGKTVFDDFYGVLSFLAFAKWMQERIGFVLPIIGGEGGWQFGAEQDNRYPKAEQPYHARYHKEMFDWFRTGLLSNGETLPDYLFSVTPWIAAGWGADDWWGGVLGTKTETVAAIQAIPAFVRRFSWGS